MTNKCTETRQGWSCLVYQNETDEDPNFYDLAFDAEGNSIHPDLYLKT
jgi:hypothetical protein